jgi:hypothetical protein
VAGHPEQARIAPVTTMTMPIVQITAILAGKPMMRRMTPRE